ncbi:hypothetical protein [Ruicaihuangia caeni]|uniref:hypothetical protein n=1 Tax=Ruicaihuangia caeni TaxID=3042517 RepID=UPI00338E66EB
MSERDTSHSDRPTDRDAGSPDVDPDDMAKQNAHSDPDRLPDEGKPGIGSSDGEVPPDAIRS